LLGSLFDPEEGGDTSFRNIDIFLPDPFVVKTVRTWKATKSNSRSRTTGYVTVPCPPQIDVASGLYRPDIGHFLRRGERAGLQEVSGITMGPLHTPLL
jgi:hypothetical protein